MNITEALFRVVDVETTGFDPKVDKIVELGACDVYHSDVDVPGWIQSTAESWLCNPGMPIPPTAKAVHHIIDEDVCDSPPAETVIAELLPAGERTVFVAHNAPFDRSFLEAAGFPPGRRWLDTYRLSMHLWAEAPSHKNEVLRYWLGFDRVPWSNTSQGLVTSAMPHRAGHDAAVTALILQELLKHCSNAHDVDELIAFADSPVVLKGLLGFGKHFDKTWEQVAGVDPGYLQWIANQPSQNWDADKHYTARHYCGRLL